MGGNGCLSQLSALWRAVPPGDFDPQSCCRGRHDLEQRFEEVVAHSVVRDLDCVHGDTSSFATRDRDLRVLAAKATVCGFRDVALPVGALGTGAHLTPES